MTLRALAKLMPHDSSVTNWETFAIQAKRDEKAEEAKAKAEHYGFRYSSKSPDFIITVGGDGTFLQAEHRYPGIPKLPVRDSLICYRCHNEPLPELLSYLIAGRGRTRPEPKLEVNHAGRSMVAMNDVVVRNAHPTQAIRFGVRVDGQVVAEQVIGDGIVAATPFGSTGYFRSVTRQHFDDGFGLAFNNPTEAKPPLLLNEPAEVFLEVIRGPGQLAVDNLPEVRQVEAGDRLMIRQAEAIAWLIAHH